MKWERSVSEEVYYTCSLRMCVIERERERQRDRERGGQRKGMDKIMCVGVCVVRVRDDGNVLIRLTAL